MPTTAAQEEFDALVSPSTRHTRHHSDASTSSVSSGGDQIARGRAIRTARAMNDSSDEDEEPEKLFRKGANDHIPLQSTSANTGPKGVIRDAKEAQRETRRAARTSKNMGWQRNVTHDTPSGQQGERHWTEDGGEVEGESSDNDDDELDDEATDDFLRQWKAQRMAEMENKKSGTSHAARSTKYGALEMVDGLGYLEAIENAARNQVIVVYICDKGSKLSDAFAMHLSTVATKHTSTRFIALDRETADMEPAGVPAILAYRGGEKFADLVPLMDEVPFTCNVVTNLEEALIAHGIL